MEIETNHKLIIHGVDVSGCEFFFRDNINGIFTQELYACMEEHTGADSYKSQCLDNPNCYFKQSARKGERIRELEEENRKLKDELACIQVNCKRNGVKYNTSDFKVFYECSCLKDEQKLSQIAQHCKTVQNRHSKGNDYMFASEIMEILAQGE